MPRSIRWTAALAFVPLTAWLASCTLEVDDQNRDGESLTIRTDVYGPANPRPASDANGPHAAPRSTSTRENETLPAEPPTPAPTERDDKLPAPSDIEIVVRDTAAARREPPPDSQARMTEWFVDADRRTRVAVLRARIRQLDELLDMLDAAELHSLDSVDATAPEATPLERRLDLFRDLRNNLRERRQALQEALNASTSDS